MDSKIERLSSLLCSGSNAVFFGGAGVSTESGIPDFRSADGLYAAQSVYGHSPEELLSHTVFEREPELFFRYFKENLIFRDAKPNPAHLALAKLERAGRLDAVITQNIDGLHQAAGSKAVLELHGSVWRHYCVRCGEKYGLDYTLAPENCGGHVPRCKNCGGIVRPDVVLYGEGLDGEVLDAAAAAVSRAKTLIVGGTSLAVYPAAGLLGYFRGNNLVLINKTATAYDRQASLVIREPIGEAMGEATEGFF
ncbi:MAG: NAD-dependent protein deacylase [Defluviitaleaceae bacterium]|nr:NAD-dependent protein deacylase [Defluviitaleaceae bacterium]